MPIRFFSEQTSFKLPHPRKTASWLRGVIKKECTLPFSLNFIFCKDDYLRKINVAYLKHNFYTDIITFDHSEPRTELEGDIYISIDRVKENAKTFKVTFDSELHRVLVHGALHLLGYDDKSPADRTEMRQKEDAYLSLRK